MLDLNQLCIPGGAENATTVQQRLRGPRHARLGRQDGKWRRKKCFTWFLLVLLALLGFTRFYWVFIGSDLIWLHYAINLALFFSGDMMDVLEALEAEADLCWEALRRTSGRPPECVRKLMANASARDLEPHKTRQCLVELERELKSTNHSGAEARYWVMYGCPSYDGNKKLQKETQRKFKNNAIEFVNNGKWISEVNWVSPFGVQECATRRRWCRYWNCTASSKASANWSTATSKRHTTRSSSFKRPSDTILMVHNRF